jgi:hypothetical protein
MPAAPAFIAHAISTDATAANITGTEPAGARINDVLIASLYIESDTAITLPAGWSDSFAGGASLFAEANTVSHAFRQYGFWIRRGNAAPALTWTFASSFRTISIVAYRGAISNENPFSFGSQAVRDDTTVSTFPNISGTTKGQNEILIWVGGTFSGGTGSTPPTGFTERADLGSAHDTGGWSDKEQATAGATGTVTGQLYTPTSNDTATSLLFGLIAAPDNFRHKGMRLKPKPFKPGVNFRCR